MPTDLPPGLTVAFTLNGAPTQVTVPDGATLLHALRGPLGLAGPRFGCGQQACGCCMVQLDGIPVPSCGQPVEAAAGRTVLTAEGLGTPEAPHALHRAFLAEQAGQCGWCLPGIIVTAAALLRDHLSPDATQVKTALDPHLCRCGSHNRIVRAVLRAAAELRARVSA